ncbi:MAG: hypothetical protein ACIAXF_00940 [Phycisphaerales bacterium JB063]
MLKLASLIQNPGEPSTTSRYNDPSALQAMGYNGLVLYATTALSGVSQLNDITDRELRGWVQKATDQAQRDIANAREAGLDTYLFYDVLALTTDTVERNPEAYCCTTGGHRVLCPASDPALAQSMEALDAMLRTFPEAAGIVLRFGDTDARRLPHLVGNDIYSPHCASCSQLGRADRVVRVIERAYDTVVARRNKRLIARAWNVRPGGFHDSADLAQRIAARLPGDASDDRLVLSFKFSHSDFWRYQRWNPSSLVCDGRPIIYELQCQREYEGKGAVPNWQVPLWRDGLVEVDEVEHMPAVDEVDQAVESKLPRVAGLAGAKELVNFAGVMAWVRGGGWGGPFISDETWIDANAYAAPRLAEDPSAPLETLALDWVRDRLGLDEHLAPHVAQVLLHSADAARRAFYMGPYAMTKGSPWHPAADWLSDDLLDADACWRMIQRIKPELLGDAVEEKHRAAAQIAKDRNDLQRLAAELDTPNKTLDRLINTLTYTLSLYETLRDLVAGLAAYRRYQHDPQRDHADTARQKLTDAQSHFNHHTQRHAQLPGTATPYREKGFWELTQRVLDEVG